MGFLLTVSEAQERLSSQDNLVNKFEIRTLKHNAGNPTGTKGRGLEAQVAAAALGRVLPHKEAARITGYCENHVSRLSRGITTQDDHTRVIKEDLKEKTDQKMVEIRDEAVTKLMLAMGMIGSENLSRCNARDLSIVASNMSRVVERTLPKEANSNNLNLVVYAPQQKSLGDFEVVEV